MFRYDIVGRVFHNSDHPAKGIQYPMSEEITSWDPHFNYRTLNVFTSLWVQQTTKSLPSIAETDGKSSDSHIAALLHFAPGNYSNLHIILIIYLLLSSYGHHREKVPSIFNRLESRRRRWISRMEDPHHAMGCRIYVDMNISEEKQQWWWLINWTITTTWLQIV